MRKISRDSILVDPELIVLRNNFVRFPVEFILEDERSLFGTMCVEMMFNHTEKDRFYLDETTLVEIDEDGWPNNHSLTDEEFSEVEEELKNQFFQTMRAKILGM